MKRCTKCYLNKRLSSFYLRKSGPRSGKYYEKCKDCMKLRGREYYQKTRKRQLELVSIRKQRYILERKNFVNELKNKPCMDCGKIYPPWVMDFDHREGVVKTKSISRIHSGSLWSIEKIKEEIEKCDLVCSNCHRQRTHERVEKSKLATVAKLVTADA